MRHAGSRARVQSQEWQSGRRVAPGARLTRDVERRREDCHGQGPQSPWGLGEGGRGVGGAPPSQARTPQARAGDPPRRERRPLSSPQRERVVLTRPPRTVVVSLEGKVSVRSGGSVLPRWPRAPFWNLVLYLTKLRSARREVAGSSGHRAGRGALGCREEGGACPGCPGPGGERAAGGLPQPKGMRRGQGSTSFVALSTQWWIP